MSLEDIFASENWHALRLEEAKAKLEQLLYVRLGIFPLNPGDRPQTDGKQIMLEKVKSDFEDDKDELHNNRNMSLYMADLLHEILHIREGSFLVDARPYMETFKNQGLAHTIMNVEDDGRIEYNAREYLHSDEIELIEESNKYYSTKRPFPKELGERFMEIYSCLKIAKGMPSIFRPGCKKEEDETLATLITDADLNAKGILTVDDLLKNVVAIGDRSYGKPIEAVWADVPYIYELLIKAFPNIEKNFPTANSMFAPTNVPMMEPPKGNGKGEKKEGEEGQGAGAGEKKEGEKEGQGAGAGEKKEGEKEGQGAGQGDQKTQTAYLGFRGDAHDYSQGKDIGSKLAAIAGEQPPVNGDKQDGGKSGSVGPGEGKVKESGLVQIVTYDPKTLRPTILMNLKMEEYRRTNFAFEGSLMMYKELIAQIKEHFAMQKPNEVQRVMFTEEPYELNMEAVLEVLSDPGLRGKARIYDSFRVNARDSLTAILLDISGSTGGELKSGKRVIDVEKAAAGILHAALTDEEVGDRVPLYAFSTSSITNLYRLPDIATLGALEPEHANADGVAIRGVISDILPMPAKEKKLIVISDGKPSAYGYGNEQGIIDTAMAFKEAEDQGIMTVYFNIDNAPAEYFARLTRHCTYARSIPDIMELPFAVGDFVMRYG